MNKVRGERRKHMMMMTINKEAARRNTKPGRERAEKCAIGGKHAASSTRSKAAFE